MGITPDIIVMRADQPVGPGIREKISLFCNVQRDCVIENLTLPCLYEAPLMLHREGLDEVVCRKLGLKTPPPDLSDWQAMVEKIHSRSRSVTIAMVGKYTRLHDAYLSVAEALRHAGYVHGSRVQILWVDSEEVTDENAAALLREADGILIPGGFGSRGIEGMVCAARYARQEDVPLLGICLGMQVMAIEFARSICGMEAANSTEFDPDTPYPVIDLMESQQGVTQKGGTMRLGGYPCRVMEGSVLERAYGQREIRERHRHRFEFNNAFREPFLEQGAAFGGLSPDGLLVESLELPRNRFHLGVQFHPEFKSRPNKAHPLFCAFVQAALERQDLSFHQEVTAQ